MSKRALEFKNRIQSINAMLRNHVSYVGIAKNLGLSSRGLWYWMRRKKLVELRVPEDIADDIVIEINKRIEKDS